MALLSLHDVSRTFGGVTAVDRVNLAVEPGEIFGLIGPNGAGKTTVLNLISGLLPVSAGRIEMKGQVISGQRPHQIARLGVARTFQIVQPLVGLTVQENVMVGAMFTARGSGRLSVKEATATSAQVLHRVGLYERRALEVTNLTLGEKKQLELAKALAMAPELLLLDEIMAGLNPAEVQETMKLVQEIRAGGVTIVVIEHVMQAIMGICDRVMVLHHGACIRVGTPEEVAHDPAVVEAYLGQRYLAQRRARQA